MAGWFILASAFVLMVTSYALCFAMCMALGATALLVWTMVSAGRILTSKKHILSRFKNSNQKIVLYFGLFSILLVEVISNVLAAVIEQTVFHAIMNTISGVLVSLLLSTLYCGSTFYWYVHNRIFHLPIQRFDNSRLFLLTSWLFALFIQTAFTASFICTAIFLGMEPNPSRAALGMAGWFILASAFVLMVTSYALCFAMQYFRITAEEDKNQIVMVS
jgi:hypothetical protein